MVDEIMQAWARILAGFRPILSIEITRECPLTCPGCYAYGEEHLGGDVILRQLSDFKGQELVDGVLNLIRKYRPLQVSIVGGEPLVRFRELSILLPQMSAMGIHTQLVTSAVRTIPAEWSGLKRVEICVSVDGLREEHDVRRKPATYERILNNIVGHSVTIHCTITSQQRKRNGYLEEFVQFWSQQDAVRRIWFSLYTPQQNERSPEILTREDRLGIISELLELRLRYPKLSMNEQTIRNYETPPESPDKCIFAQVTTCISADLQKRITPCQFGGTPDCKNCGCMATAGFESVGRFKLLPGLPVSRIFDASFKTGSAVNRIRQWASANSNHRDTESTEKKN